MPSYSREFTVLSLVGATLWLPQCSQLTKVDWSQIEPGGGTTSAAGTSGSVGTMAGDGTAGENTEAGEGGLGGAAGEAGASGSAGEEQFGETGGASAGSGASGGGGAGTGGTLGGNGGGAGVAGAASSNTVHGSCNVAPPTPTTPPDLSNKIIFFDGGQGTNGDRRAGESTARKGLDKACATAKAALHLPGSEVHAVISIDPADEIFDMPLLWSMPTISKPIVSPLGIEISGSWNTFWATISAPSLVCTGVMAPGSAWLTGTSLDKQGDNLDPHYGSYSGVVGGENATCDGWTNSTLSPTVRAQVGSARADHDLVSPNFFLNFFVTTCDVAVQNVLCATYDP